MPDPFKTWIEDNAARFGSANEGDENDLRRFRDPGGQSSLYPGKRTRPCPKCGTPRALTRRDVEAGYQCDRCAERTERGED